ncbi:hypothetical protein AgCh_019637 [Apium graveolens]
MSSKKSRMTEVNSNALEQSSESHNREEAVNRLKSNMENRFCYIPPKDKCNNTKYLHYARKKDEGAYTYAAHADYYILLRACARVAQIDLDTCEFCCDDEVEVNATDRVEVNATDDPVMGFSDLNL